MLASYVKKQPFFWKYIPWLQRHHGTTIGTVIFLRPDIYNDLLTENPQPEHVGIILHEETHVRRAKQIGLLKFGLGYIFNPAFRFNEELLATKASFEYLKKKKIKVDLKRRATILSGWLYFWPVSYEYALREIIMAWKTV